MGNSENHIAPTRGEILHPAWQLGLCLFRLFKIIYRKEKQSKRMKGQIRKIYQAFLTHDTGTIIPMIRWSFE
jgi:hypothetical protein